MTVSASPGVAPLAVYGRSMSWHRAAPWLVLFALTAAVGAGVLDGLGGGGGLRCGRVRGCRRGDARRRRRHDPRAGRRPRRERPLHRHRHAETVKPDTPVQCFGKPASAANHRLVTAHASSCASTPSPATATAGCSPMCTASATACSSMPRWCGRVCPDPHHPAQRQPRRRPAGAGAPRRAPGRGLWGACRREPGVMSRPGC